jgi:hypothetical protein
VPFDSFSAMTRDWYIALHSHQKFGGLFIKPISFYAGNNTVGVLIDIQWGNN